MYLKKTVNLLVLLFIIFSLDTFTCRASSVEIDNDEVPLSQAKLNFEKELVDVEEVKIGGGYAVTGQLDEVGYISVLYDATNGLPTSEANYVLGGSDGYIYIGGYSGIIRYDGISFDRYSANSGLTSGRGLFEDCEGNIWVATNDNGVMVILKDGSTIHYTKADGLNSLSIRTFAEDAEGTVYIGSTAGVAYVDSNRDLYPVDDERINNERILRLVSDAAGNVYGQTKSGLVFSLIYGKVDEIYSSEDLGSEKITSILADPKDEKVLYFGTDSNTIYHGTFGEKVEDMEKMVAGTLNTIHWLSYDCNRIWASGDSKIGYFDEKGYFKYLSKIQINDSIEMMTSDYQGNIWIASSRQGVVKVVANNFMDYSATAGYSDDVVNATCYFRNILYVGTDRGLKAIGPNHTHVNNSITDYVGMARVRCLFNDGVGHLWISTFTDDLGLICVDEDANITNITEDDGLPSNEVRCTVLKEDGTLIVGTNGGVAFIKDGKVTDTITAIDGINNTVILTVCEGFDGEVFGGSDGDGLYIINEGNIKRIGTEDGLTSDVIMRLKKDEKNGVIWIITSNAIEYYKDGNITHVTTFPYNNNFDIIRDEIDNLWILSSQGVYMVTSESMLNDNIKEYRLYTLANGLTSLPVSHGYSEFDDNGNLYIAGQSGVCKVNLEHYFEKNSRIKIKVKSIFCDETEILPDANLTYVIPSDCNRLQITPAVLDYTMSNPTVHIYLAQADNTGITSELANLGTLEYTGLPYGSYVLHIQILDRGNGNVIGEETFLIRKEPKLTELTVFKVMLGLLIAAIAGIIVWRVMAGTIIRRQYAQIREAKSEAERANLAKSRFLANMSHEIRTPINTIMGMDEMILREEPTGVPKPYFLSVIGYALDIRNASESLLAIINDVLDISKIESGKMHLVEREYDVSKMLRQIITMIRVRSNEKKLYFNVDIDKSLPVKMFGDDKKIKQIVLNLLTNAVKYTAEGGFTLSIAVTGRNDDKCDLRISVKDTGIGVKEEDLDKLFNAYERLDEEKNSGIQGTGLGLDISRQFSELMNGKLWCESEYGKGSEFIFTLSQKVVDSTPIGEFKEEDESETKGPYVPLFTAPDAKILVVDDNPMNLNVIKGLLKPTKVAVTTADSGKECLAILEKEQFNVILLDHMMPEMDGIETLSHIRETNTEVPVYALTANAAAGGDKFYKSKGFTGYLGKPIDTKVLEQTILSHLPESIVKKPETGTYLTDEPENLSDEYLWLYEIPEISVNDGIKASGGVNSYITSVELFYDTIDDNSGVIEEAYKTGDIKLYTIKVHALKTSARFIGAGELSKLCQDLEDAGNAGNIDFIDSNEEKRMSIHRGLKAKLSRIKGDKESSVDLPEIPEDELAGAYEALKELIPQMDYDSVEMVFDELKSYRLPDTDREKFEKAEKLLKAFKWDELEEILM